MDATLESKELMELCLKRVRGLNKVKIVDACFIWTEPHSRRVKVKITIEKEIQEGAKVEQSFVVEYVIHNQQCEMCEQEATGNSRWSAVVQLRQKVSHRRSFLYLEQLILKHQMHQECTKIQIQPDGIDFFFVHRMHGLRFLEFVQSKVPTNRRDALQLVTMDVKSNTAEIHHTFSAEIAPICREDLVFLPKKISVSMGGLGPIVLCYKVNANIVFLDPFTLQSGEIMGALYWKKSFKPIASSRQLVEFFVIDIVARKGVVNGKLQLAEATICMEDEIGQGREWIVNTHLGNVLKPGDSAMGYLLPSVNSTNEDFDVMVSRGQCRGDVLLVHKRLPKRRERRWKIDFLKKEADKQFSEEQDMEQFMDDIERDAEYRKEFIVHDQVKIDNGDEDSKEQGHSSGTEWETDDMED
ncbi:hypothetical protein XU18_0067 [Perkinsela sp. CCAP 1560/4]|nr:hypothetical protein XU18_0067 [Perkinsela sp. CCAP 1560/4]|eukprot:KNH09382.1 hypothetical protein XU18_0067 [Perkinsela sp. CCAP 1560/4]